MIEFCIGYLIGFAVCFIAIYFGYRINESRGDDETRK